MRKLDFYKATSIPVRILFIMWLLFTLDFVFKIDMKHLSLLPRDFIGLKGVFFAPLIHLNPAHIRNNSLPFFVLSTLLFLIYPKLARQVFIYIYLGSGILVWLIGRYSYHLGASGLIFGLAGFIIIHGIFTKSIVNIFISIIVLLVYSYLGFGLLPAFILESNEYISVEGHWAGLVVGSFLGYYYRKH